MLSFGQYAELVELIHDPYASPFLNNTANPYNLPTPALFSCDNAFSIAD